MCLSNLKKIYRPIGYNIYQSIILYVISLVYDNCFNFRGGTNYYMYLLENLQGGTHVQLLGTLE